MSPPFSCAKQQMPSLSGQELNQQLTALAERVAEGTGIEVVEVDVRGAGKSRLLRVYIDKPNGVTHGDCELISEQFGKALDEQDVVPGDSYTLEVSSPGVERKLTKPRDFERVIGQKIRVSLRQPIGGLLRCEGTLTGLSGDNIAVQVTPEQVLDIPLDQVQKANLKFEW
jgi:ribosome maturation factor RimP